MKGLSLGLEGTNARGLVGPLPRDCRLPSEGGPWASRGAE